MRTFTVDRTAALKEALRRGIGEERYQLWFADKTKFTWSERGLVVGVPNLFYQDWLGKKFNQAVADAAGSLTGEPPLVRFIIDPQLFQQTRGQDTASVPAEDDRTPSGGRTAPALPTDIAAPAPRPQPSREAAPRTRAWCRLEDFVVGAGNRVAHAAALSVAEAPGQGPNPLVVYGPVGTGKSHLLEGIAASLRENQPQLRCCLLTAEDFTNRFLGSLRNGKIAGFRKLVRDADVLLLDDLPFLARKNATQEEFLHTLDSLLRGGQQVVVTCDCHPRLADELAPELADRLLGGAVWGLLPPDQETRLALLRKKTTQPGHAVWPADVLELLSSQLRGNVRELEGAIHAVRHWSRVSGRPLDLALAREALGDLLRHAVRIVRLDDVEAAVCKALALSTGSLQSKQRNWKVSHPRMLALFLARKHTSATFTEIGQRFGGRNHSTVVAGEKKVRSWLAEGAKLKIGDSEVLVRDVLERIERELLR